MTRTAAIVASLLAVLAVGPWGRASAQVKLGGFNVEGEGEAGARFFIEEPSGTRRGKFEEYRDIPEGAFLERLRLRIFVPDESYAFEFGGSKWGQQDQEFSLRAGRLGLWELGLDWDQIPHIFSTTARMLATETARGVFTLPTPRPSLSAYNGARRLDEISERWDTARLSLLLTPTPDLEVRAEYTRIRKDGDRPFGMAFGSPGNNFLEILEPIEQTIQEFRLRGTLAREQWQLQFGYTFSMFNNEVKSVTADNPCFGLTAAVTAAAPGCGADATGAPRGGMMSLAPDNMAHTLTLGGGVNLPFRTRVNANFSYSLRFQDESFLPHTVNPAITSPALTLPAKSLDGFVSTTLLNLYATSRPLPPLTLSAKYRLFDLADHRDELVLPGHVVNDRTLVVEDRLAGRWSYTKQNADVDARWRWTSALATTLGGGWERWDRNAHREVPTSDEYFGKAAVDANPFDWLLAKLTYRPSWRRIDQYNTTAHLTHSVLEADAIDIAQGQSALLRKFDEAERDRQRVDLMLQLMPTEAFTTTLTGGWTKDDYIRSDLGLQDTTNWSAGIDFNWRPVERISFFGGYTHELIFQKQRSRSRPVTGTTTFDFPDFDWISDNTDTVDTFHLGANLALIPKVLDWTFVANYSYALGRVETRNPEAVTSGTAAQRTSAIAQPTPAFEDSLFRLETALKYHFGQVWTLSLKYVFESFAKHDWRTDTLNPFVPGVTSIWLGNDARNYDAHIVALTLGVRFK